MVKILVESGASVNCMNQMPKCCKLIRYLISKGASSYGSYNTGLSGMMIAVINGNLEDVKLTYIL